MSGRRTLNKKGSGHTNFSSTENVHGRSHFEATKSMKVVILHPLFKKNLLELEAIFCHDVELCPLENIGSF